MTNGKIRVLSDVGMDSIIFDDSGFVFDDPNYAGGGTPFINGSVTAGAFYIKNLAVWPFFTDSTGLQSLINYFS
jgi:hypothetical protein